MSHQYSFQSMIYEWSFMLQKIVHCLIKLASLSVRLLTDFANFIVLFSLDQQLVNHCLHLVYHILIIVFCFFTRPM